MPDDSRTAAPDPAERRRAARRLLNAGELDACLEFIAAHEGEMTGRDADHLGAAALIRKGAADQAWPPLERLAAALGEDINPALEICALFHGAGDSAAILRFTDLLLGRDVDAAQLRGIRASAYRSLGRPVRAIAEYQAALKLDPNNRAMRHNLGIELANVGRFVASGRVLEPLLAAGEANADTFSILASALMNQGRQREGVAAYQAAIAKDPDAIERYSKLLFAMNHAEECDQAMIVRWSERYGRLAERAAAGKRPAFGPRGERPVRVAFVSSDFRTHSVFYFLRAFLEHLDRDRIEPVLVYTNTIEDDATRWMRALPDRFVDAGRWDDDRFVAEMRALDLDIALDLNGHTANARLGCFARRIARAQAAWLGYPNTTGLAAMDWRITDALVDPPERAGDGYSESMLRMEPPFLCYTPPQPRPAPRETPPAAEAGHPTFGCFNKLWKATPSAIAAWCEILRRAPDARLALKGRGYDDPDSQARLLGVFEAEGIARERVRFLPRAAATADHLDAYNQIDIALDAFPYNGTTTTLEALAMGVPVLSFAGDRHAARVSWSIGQAMGIDALAIDTREAMIETAVRLAGDVAAIGALRSQVRDRFAGSALCDGPGFARRFARALEEIAERSANGAPDIPAGAL